MWQLKEGQLGGQELWKYICGIKLFIDNIFIACNYTALVIHDHKSDTSG